MPTTERLPTQDPVIANASVTARASAQDHLVIRGARQRLVLPFVLYPIPPFLAATSKAQWLRGCHLGANERCFSRSTHFMSRTEARSSPDSVEDRFVAIGVSESVTVPAMRSRAPKRP